MFHFQADWSINLFLTSRKTKLWILSRQRWFLISGSESLIQFLDIYFQSIWKIFGKEINAIVVVLY